MSESITEKDRFQALADGRKAFEDGKLRCYNPHITRNEVLAFYWASGWNQAEQESKTQQDEP